MLSFDPDEAIRQFYVWSRQQDPSDIGYPHSDTLARLRGSVVKSAGISDDEALWLNEIIRAWRNENPRGAAIADRVYRDGKSVRWTARRLKVSARTAQNELLSLRSHVGGAICANSVVRT